MIVVAIGTVHVIGSVLVHLRRLFGGEQRRQASAFEARVQSRGDSFGLLAGQAAGQFVDLLKELLDTLGRCLLYTSRCV